MAVILPGSAFPPGFPVLPDSEKDGGPYDLKREQSSTPQPLSHALESDRFIAGYQRNWLQSGPSPAAGWVALLAFHDSTGAEDFKAQVAAYYETLGLVGDSAAAVAPGAMAYTSFGPKGMSYSVVAVRDGVIVEVAAGGAGITTEQVSQLAKEQLARL